MRNLFQVSALCAVLAAGPATALELDCVAERACVANLDVACDAIEVVYGLDVGDDPGDKLVLTTDEGERFYEFRRLANAGGVLVQAAGGALEPGQGAGAMTVFEDMRFVLTRHSLITMDESRGPDAAVSISIHGRCEPRE